jgi:hypothetical protein
VQLTAQTQLTGALTCEDLQLGELVRGEGQIKLAMPGGIVATPLAVIGPPTSGQPLHLKGFVATIDCVTGALQLRDDGTTIDVGLSLGGHPKPANDGQLKTGQSKPARQDVDGGGGGMPRRRDGKRLERAEATASNRVGVAGMVAATH